MIEISIDRADWRSWLVCESGQRWVCAVRRFSPDLMPRPLVPEITQVDPEQAIAKLSAGRDRPVVVLWESSAASLLPVCDQIIAAAHESPNSLQLVAAPNRSVREHRILMELPCTALVRHPEDLPRLQGMIRSYFRRSPDLHRQ